MTFTNSLNNTTTVYVILKAWECYLPKPLQHNEKDRGKWNRKNIRTDIQKNMKRIQKKKGDQHTYNTTFPEQLKSDKHTLLWYDLYTAM